jgi:hypothetical protein
MPSTGQSVSHMLEMGWMGQKPPNPGGRTEEGDLHPVGRESQRTEIALPRSQSLLFARSLRAAVERGRKGGDVQLCAHVVVCRKEGREGRKSICGT